MLLQDILFSQGFGTRYDCAEIISKGGVTIGDAVHDDPREEIDVENLEFTCFGRVWPYCEKAVIALHKPAGYECSMKPSSHPSVMTLLPSPLRRRNVQPVGRLDVDTTGLLIM
ncbi:ribosomal small subunit pseudouridine synthase A, partial [gut metagenome]